MKILIINGVPRSGKSTFCDNAHDNCSFIYPISTIDRVKQVALFAGWSGEKNAKGRKFLSDLKDIMTEYDDIPHRYVTEFIRNRVGVLDRLDMISADNAIFLVQSREPEDIQRFVDELGAKTLLICREDADINWGNHADDEVENYQYDYVLYNNGTLEDWQYRTVNFIETVRKEDWESHI